MKALRLAALSAITLLSLGSAVAQKTTRPADPKLDYEAVGSPLKAAPADPQILAALKSVSTEKIKANIIHLVEFNNRSTISSTETDLKPGTGVFAAADWIKSQFESYSKDCGGCLEVQFDEFAEQPQPGFNNSRPRIIKPTPIRNIFAILRL
jgi:hypothetical protein